MRMLLARVFLPRETKKLLRILPTMKSRLAPSDMPDGSNAVAIDGTDIDQAVHASMWVDIEAEAKRLILEDRAASAVTLTARQHSADQLCLYYVAEALRNDLMDTADVLQEGPNRSAEVKLALFAQIIDQLVIENVLSASEGRAISTALRASTKPLSGTVDD